MQIKTFKTHSNYRGVLILTGAIVALYFSARIAWGLYLFPILLQLLLPITWLCVAVLTLINFIEIFRLWQNKRFLSLIPFAISLIALFAGDDIQFWTKVLHFKYYQKDFETVIEMIRTDEIDVRVERPDLRIPIPDGQLPCCYVMHAGKGSDNTVSATFFLGGGFPCKHCGVIYTETSPSENEKQRRTIPLSPTDKGLFYFWHD